MGYMLLWKHHAPVYLTYTIKFCDQCIIYSTTTVTNKSGSDYNTVNNIYSIKQ